MRRRRSLLPAPIHASAWRWLRTVLENEVVITASRVSESILRSPVAIQKLDIRAIKESPAPTFYDARYIIQR
jgi:hypothetical protein